MKHTKWIALLILLAMLLAACGGAAETEAPAVDEPAVDEPAMDEPSEPFRVAVVMPSAVNDLAFSQSMFDALAKVQGEMGGEANFTFDFSEGMFVVDDAAAAIRDYAAEGFDFVIAHGSQYGSSLQEIAPDFPDTSFAWGTTSATFAEEGITNIFAYEAASDQGGYVNGVIAGLMTESNVIGVVGPIETGDAKLYVDGFVAGAKSANPAAQVNVNYIGSFSDVALAAEAANTHIAAGADVLTGTAQMVVGAIGVAEENGALWLGTQSSQTSLAPSVVVANQIYDWSVVLNQMLDNIKAGTLGGEAYLITLENGGEAIELNPDFDLPADVSDQVQATIDGIIAGDIDTLSAAPAEGSAADDTLGTEDNPIVWVLVPSQDTEAVLTGAEEIAQAIEDSTGLIVEPLVTTDFTGAVEAMCSGEAHMGALNTFNYVLANARGCAEVSVASSRFGSTFYSGQVITTADSGIESIEDLAGKTFCRPDPTSTSGWVIPSIAMQAAGLDPEADLAEIVDAGGHDGVVLAVYNGDCDAGSTFVDARGNIEEDFPDVLDVVVVIEESAPIPNDNISYAPAVNADTRDAVTGVLLELASDEAGLEILNSVYSWSGMEVVGDDFYDGFRQQLEAAGVDIEDLIN